MKVGLEHDDDWDDATDGDTVHACVWCAVATEIVNRGIRVCPSCREIFFVSEDDR